MIYACSRCKDTGVIETGNNDLPCTCLAGDTALFNQAGVRGQVTGAEIRRHFYNNSPEPIETGREGINATDLPGRRVFSSPVNRYEILKGDF